MKKILLVLVILLLVVIGGCELMVDKLRANRVEAIRISTADMDQREVKLLTIIKQIESRDPNDAKVIEELAAAKKLLKHVRETKQSNQEELKRTPRPWLFGMYRTIFR